MSVTFAVCLGSFVAILPNDSYYWLVKSDAFPEYSTGRSIVRIPRIYVWKRFALRLWLRATWAIDAPSWAHSE